MGERPPGEEDDLGGFRELLPLNTLTLVIRALKIEHVASLVEGEDFDAASVELTALCQECQQ